MSVRPPSDGSDAELWYLRGYEAGVMQEIENRSAGMADLERLRAAIDRVRALHWPSPDRDPACDCYDGLDTCPTIAALHGYDQVLARAWDGAPLAIRGNAMFVVWVPAVTGLAAHCVRDFALADVPAAVQPLNERNIHPQRRDAQSRRRTWATAMGLRRPHGRLP